MYNNDATTAISKRKKMESKLIRGPRLDEGLVLPLLPIIAVDEKDDVVVVVVGIYC